MSEPICDIDLHAFVDGELDDERRLQVLAHLSRNPALAAQVMADMHLGGLLKLSAARKAADAPSHRVYAAAQMLGKRLSKPARPAVRRLPWLAVAAAMIVAVTIPASLPIVGSGAASAAPTYLADAVRAHRTLLMRATMQSQLESPQFDAAEVVKATRIRVPRLPDGWQIRDVQLLPSSEGAALQMSITTAAGEKVSMFAVYGASTAPAEPAAIHYDGVSVAYWQEGAISYAVVGDGSVSELDRLADDLEDNELA